LIRKSPVTVKFVVPIAEDAVDGFGRVGVSVSTEEEMLVIFDTIDKLLSIDWGSPNTTVVVV
jgi:hypothetical protein